MKRSVSRSHDWLARLIDDDDDCDYIHSTIGARITTVRTIDAEGDMITFSLEPGPFLDGSKYLRIDERTGDVYLKESLTGQVGRLFSLHTCSKQSGRLEHLQVDEMDAQLLP